MNQKENSFLFKYKKQISYLSYIELFSPILTFLFIILVATFYPENGYGLGVLLVLSILMSLLFGITSVMLDLRIRYLEKRELQFLSTLKLQTTFSIPCIIH